MQISSAVKYAFSSNPLLSVSPSRFPPSLFPFCAKSATPGSAHRNTPHIHQYKKNPPSPPAMQKPASDPTNSSLAKAEEWIDGELGAEKLCGKIVRKITITVPTPSPQERTILRGRKRSLEDGAVQV